jgi:branched-chain amino acid transport system permease protein
MVAGGDAPGIDLVVYGCVLVLIIWLAPRGLIGGLTQLRSRMMRPAPFAEAGHG